MTSPLSVLFDDPKTVTEIQRKLPKLFWIANQECSRGGKLGQEVGKVREKILAVLVMSKLGKDNVRIDVPTTHPEANLIVKQTPVSVITLSVANSHFSGAGVKINWSGNAVPGKRFVDTYTRPKSDILFTIINFSSTGKLLLIPMSVQEEVFQKMGRYSYFRAPSVSEDSRGVEFKPSALLAMTRHKDTRTIDIPWHKAVKPVDSFSPYRRWEIMWFDESLYDGDKKGGGGGGISDFF